PRERRPRHHSAGHRPSDLPRLPGHPNSGLVHRQRLQPDRRAARLRRRRRRRRAAHARGVHRRMRSRINLVVTVAYLAICAVVLVGIVASIGITWPGQHPYRLTAVFSGGSGILPKNEVYVDGVKVGRVDGVQAVGGQARVTMTIDDTAALPFYKDSSAEVRQKNLLNENYVDISRGSATTGVMASG